MWQGTPLHLAFVISLAKWLEKRKKVVARRASRHLRKAKTFLLKSSKRNKERGEGRGSLAREEGCYRAHCDLPPFPPKSPS